MEALNVMQRENMKHGVTYSFTFLCRNIGAYKSSFPAFFNFQCTQELCLFSSKAHAWNRICNSIDVTEFEDNNSLLNQLNESNMNISNAV